MLYKQLLYRTPVTKLGVGMYMTTLAMQQAARLAEMSTDIPRTWLTTPMSLKVVHRTQIRKSYAGAAIMDQIIRPVLRYVLFIIERSSPFCYENCCLPVWLPNNIDLMLLQDDIPFSHWLFAFLESLDNKGL